MTWGIQKRYDRPAQGPDIGPVSNMTGIGAATEMAWQDVNVYMQRQRQVIGAEEDLARQAIPLLGPDAMGAIINDFNAKTTELGLPERTIPEGASVDDIMSRLGANGTKVILDAARAAAEENPEVWAGIDVSDEALQQRVTDARVAERQTNEELLALTPNPVRNSLLGGIVGAVADPVNLATIPLGGWSGSIWRVMLTEGALNAGIEAAQHPSRVAVSKELGTAEPDLLESMTLGFLGGAALGGIVEAVPRGIRAVSYLRKLKRDAKVDGLKPVAGEDAVRSAEAAIDAGKNPLDEVKRYLDATPEAKMPPLILGDGLRVREPLILTPEMSVTAKTPEATPLAPNPITTESLPPIEGNAPTTPGETAALAERALNRVPKEPKNPILTAIKRAGGVDPKGTFADELRNMGITHKTIPGLFRKGGIREGDNLVASEWGERVPGLEYRAGNDGNGYLDRNGLFKAIDEEMRGIRPEGRVRSTNPEAYNPQQAFLSGQKSDTGFFVDRDPFTEEVAWDRSVERAFDQYLTEKWGHMRFLPEEVAEMKATLEKYGGEAEDLIARVLERDLDEAEAALTKSGGLKDAGAEGITPRAAAEDAGLAGPGRGDAVQPGPEPTGAPADRAGSGRNPRVEATAAGEQFVIPGSRENDVAARQAARAKAEAEVKALQSKQRRLNQVRVEDDVDGLFAQKQGDIFDDIMSPEAQRFMDENLEAMRAIAAEEGGMKVSAVADDGRQLNSLQAIIDEIDDEEALAREFDLCRGGDVPF